MVNYIIDYFQAVQRARQLLEDEEDDEWWSIAQPL